VRELTTTSGHAALVGSHLLHVRDGVLLAYERDRESGDLSPRGVPVGIDVGVSAAGRALFAASPALLLHAPGAARATEVVWLDFAGVRGSAAADAGDHWQVRLSRDDRQVAVASIDPLLHAFDIGIAPADGSAAVLRQTLALAADTDPVWSPDGNRVLFRSMEGGTPDLFARRTRQSEPASEVILRSELDETPTDWLGDRILFQVRGKTGSDVMVLHTRTGHYGPVADTAFNETDARWSPDGQWMAYVSDESGQPDVYARGPDATRVRVSFAGGRRPRWTRDGRSIVFLRGSQIMRADRRSDGAAFAPARTLFEAPGIRDFDVAHGSDRLIALLPVPTAPGPAIAAVLNWTSLLRSAQATR
jgi:eukaryotic-like serine/threonine-protein kinase